jgi:pilus assembly protein CpaD
MIPTRNLLPAAALAAAALCLTACATTPKGTAKKADPPITPGAQFTLKTETTTDKIALALHPDGLSKAQLAALQALAARRAEVEGGVVTLKLPQGAADAAAAGRAADAAQAALNAAGATVQRTTYESDDPKAPLLVSFEYDGAEIPKCGRWDDLTKTGDNQVYSNFGCAVTANMAAQIANPTDIVHPRAEDAPDVERRTSVLAKYREGKPTPAEEPQAKSVNLLAHVGQ